MSSRVARLWRCAVIISTRSPPAGGAARPSHIGDALERLDALPRESPERRPRPPRRLSISSRRVPMLSRGRARWVGSGGVCGVPRSSRRRGAIAAAEGGQSGSSESVADVVYPAEGSSPLRVAARLIRVIREIRGSETMQVRRLEEQPSLARLIVARAESPFTVYEIPALD